MPRGFVGSDSWISGHDDLVLISNANDDGQPKALWRRLIIPAAVVDAMADAAAFTAEGCVAGSVGELNDGVYGAGPEGAGQRSSSWGRVCSVLGSRPGGGCVSC
jgi:hypothetical protein